MIKLSVREAEQDGIKPPIQDLTQIINRMEGFFRRTGRDGLLLGQFLESF